MRSILAAILLLLIYGSFIMPFADHMKARPVAVKLGYVPKAEITRMAAYDFRFLLSEMNVIKVLFYFGTLADQQAEDVYGTPEYGSMYSQLVQAAKLDPYNQDIYYFSQAIFTWDLGRVLEVNKLLEYGMRYKKNDWRLPYYAGFNSAYFLSDFDSAARYFQKAAEISGNELFTKLAARYFHAAGKGDLGILFLDAMIKSAKNPSVKETYVLRKNALIAALTLQKAADAFRERYDRIPETVDQLVNVGLVDSIPDDPYGGTFFITDEGKIETTSKFAVKAVLLDSGELNGADKNE